MLSGNDIDIKIDFGEVYRYLGYGGHEPDGEAAERIDACAEEILSVSELRGMYEKFPLTFYDEEGSFSIGDIPIVSKGLAKNLKGCTAVYLMGATIGIGIDRLIARASISDMTAAAIYQAIGAAYVETYCDYINDEIKGLAAREGFITRPRFSPGYGDFSLDYQRDIFRLLNLPKHVGISLTESLLMSPSKSVTAVIGLRPKAIDGEEGPGESYECPEESGPDEGDIPHQKGKKCEACGMTDCPFRVK